MNIRYLAALVTAATLGLAAIPAYAQFVNGSFETSNGTNTTGGYFGWTLQESPRPPAAGYDYGTLGIAPDAQAVRSGTFVYDYFYNVNVAQTTERTVTYTATDGTHVALALQNGSMTQRMYQDVPLSTRATTISWDMAYFNDNSGISIAGRQELTVTLRDPATDSVLAVLFSTATPGEAQLISTMQNFNADVADYAGRTVRISVEVISGDSSLDAAFDNFRVGSACPPKGAVTARFHYSANGSPGKWSGTKSTNCSDGSVVIGPQPTEGDLKLSPGTAIKTGYIVSLPKNKKPFTVNVTNATVVFVLSCVGGAAPTQPTLTILMNPAQYPVTGAEWVPTGDQKSALGYQGSGTIPDACNGGVVSLKKGGTFFANIGLN